MKKLKESNGVTIQPIFNSIHYSIPIYPKSNEKSKKNRLETVSYNVRQSFTQDYQHSNSKNEKTHGSDRAIPTRKKNLDPALSIITPKDNPHCSKPFKPQPETNPHEASIIP